MSNPLIFCEEPGCTAPAFARVRVTLAGGRFDESSHLRDLCSPCMAYAFTDESLRMSIATQYREPGGTPSERRLTAISRLVQRHVGVMWSGRLPDDADARRAVAAEIRELAARGRSPRWKEFIEFWADAVEGASDVMLATHAFTQNAVYAGRRA